MSSTTEIDWAPLERFVAVVGRRVDGLDCADFMYMGAVEPLGSGPIHLYKHIDTRRYLNLDGSGHAYRYDGRSDCYHPLAGVTEAVEALELDAF